MALLNNPDIQAMLAEFGDVSMGGAGAAGMAALPAAP